MELVSFSLCSSNSIKGLVWKETLSLATLSGLKMTNNCSLYIEFGCLRSTKVKNSKNKSRIKSEDCKKPEAISIIISLSIIRTTMNSTMTKIWCSTSCRKKKQTKENDYLDFKLFIILSFRLSPNLLNLILIYYDRRSLGKRCHQHSGRTQL